MRPAVGSRARSIRRPVVVLPQPLSPTSPRVWPASRRKLTPSTPRTVPATRRSSPRRTGKCLLWPGRTAARPGISRSQTSPTFSRQRGWKGHPDGSAWALGTLPSIGSSFSALAARLGIERSRAAVYGCAGAPKILSTGPSSTTRPRYIT